MMSPDSPHAESQSCEIHPLEVQKPTKASFSRTDILDDTSPISQRTSSTRPQKSISKAFQDLLENIKRQRNSGAHQQTRQHEPSAKRQERHHGRQLAERQAG